MSAKRTLLFIESAAKSAAHVSKNERFRERHSLFWKSRAHRNDERTNALSVLIIKDNLQSNLRRRAIQNENTDPYVFDLS